MSYWGNDCFITCFDGVAYEESGFWNINDALTAHKEKGDGWYGVVNQRMTLEEMEEYREDDPENFIDGGIIAGWYPTFVWLDGCYDKYQELSFEAWDNNCDTIVFAGDGEKPYEHVLFETYEGEMVYGNFLDENAPLEKA